MALRIGRILFIIISIGGLIACWNATRNIQGDATEPIVINVLDRQLYDDCHIKGSVHVDLDNLENYVQHMAHDTEIVLYCTNYMCSTSEYAAKRLQKLGFTHVWVYDGGTAEWYQKGLPVEGPSRSSYLKKKIDAPEDMSDTHILRISAQVLAQKMGMTTESVAA